MMLLTVPISVFAVMQGGEYVYREFSANSTAAGTNIIVKYHIANVSDKWGVSVVDRVSGCSFETGSEINYVAISDMNELVKSYEVTAGTGTVCTFAGDYKFGTFPTTSLKGDTSFTITGGSSSSSSGSSSSSSSGSGSSSSGGGNITCATDIFTCEDGANVTRNASRLCSFNACPEPKNSNLFWIVIGLLAAVVLLSLYKSGNMKKVFK